MIEVNNLTTNPIDENFLKKAAKIVLEGEGKGKSDLSIALIGPGKMRGLNKKYLGKNRVTDILAFGESQKSKFKSQKLGELGLGEIVICLREVKKNAKKFKLSFEKELARVLIHGILHLVGYDHEKNEKEAEKMEEKEKYYLKLIETHIGEGSGEPFGSPV
jgi:rRNA maturation RNase YbeY